MCRHSCERPGRETFREAGVGNLCGPVVVSRRVAARVDGVLERLHEAVEVGPEAGGRGLAEVAGDEMALALSPFGAPVFEPDLQNKTKLIIFEL